MNRNATTSSEASLDSRARRAAKRAGLRAEKSRVKTYCWNFQGGYQLIDDRNNVVNGVNYDLTAKQVIEYCSEHH